jgi:endonuclease/exonuclease/phosphatase (EEP) superfamily protein YafD
MLFAPRWIYALPMVVLVPAAAAARRRLLWPLLGAAVVIVGPIMGLCLPWKSDSAGEGPVVRVLTCNVQGRCLDGAALMEMVDRLKPDVVALQEYRSAIDLSWPAGWRAHKRSALVVASPHPLRDVAPWLCRHPGRELPTTHGIRCVVEKPHCLFTFVNVHLSSPRHGLATVLDRRTVVAPSRSAALVAAIAGRRREAESFAGWVVGSSGPVILAGDFNMPTDSAIYRDVWGGYDNAFSQTGFGFGYTKWSSIHGLIYGLRVDHMLSESMSPRRCWVERDVGSDHRPLAAELVGETSRSDHRPSKRGNPAGSTAP